LLVVAKLHTSKGGSASWGRPGDELIEATVDEYDPAYDSDELSESAFGSSKLRGEFTDEDELATDELATDEIEVAMWQDWIEQARVGHSPAEDE
jgi:hypothetical protein